MTATHLDALTLRRPRNVTSAVPDPRLSASRSVPDETRRNPRILGHTLAGSPPGNLLAPSRAPVA